MAEAVAWRAVPHLPPTRLAPELERRLPDLSEPGRPAGVPARDETAIGRHRHPAAEREIAALDAGLGLARAAQAEQLIVLELLDREGVVDLDEV